MMTKLPRRTGADAKISPGADPKNPFGADSEIFPGDFGLGNQGVFGWCGGSNV